MSTRDERVALVQATLREHSLVGMSIWDCACRCGQQKGDFSDHQAGMVLAALADDPAQAQAAEANYELAFYRANEACSVREAALARVEALFAGGPDTACRTVWRDSGFPWGNPVECVEVPLVDLRAALADGPTVGSEQ